jgi:hypothetical protein
MLIALRKAWKWASRNSKYILFIGLSLLLFILAFAWYRKNKTIRKLEAELVILRAKVKLERLAVKNEVLVEDLNKLKKEDLEVAEEISIIEKSLEERLSKDLTAEEIAQKFRELGV